MRAIADVATEEHPTTPVTPLGRPTLTPGGMRIQLYRDGAGVTWTCETDGARRTWRRLKTKGESL